MKCIVCRGPATFKTHHHNAKFCLPHFRQHIQRQVRRVIEKYAMFTRAERVLLGVSGGKDSMVAWEILTELGYQPLAVHIDAGFGDASEEAVAVVRTFARRRGLPLRVLTYPEILGFDFASARAHSRKPVCSLCGTLKRYSLNRLAARWDCDVVATGHNLDDETAFLLGNLLHWQLGFLRRQGPVLPAEPGMVRKVKPLTRLTDDDTRQYAEACGIPIVRAACPHGRDATSRAHKRMLDRLEEQFPGTRAEFYFGFVDQVRASLPQADRPAAQSARYCSECGYKTLRDERCYVCTLRDQLRVAVTGEGARG